MKKLSFLLVLSLLLAPVAAGAYDYKAWVPLLPKTLGGMVPDGTPDGMNMDMGGQKWSTLTQEYASKDGKQTAQFSVVAGQVAPQVQGFQSMAAMHMSMETDEQVIKTVDVSGKKAMLVLDKQEKMGTLTIPVKQDMVVVINLEPATSPSDLTGLAQQVSLSGFEQTK